MKQKKDKYSLIDKIGLLEILFVLYPIVGSYAYGSVPMLLLWLLFMDIVVILRKQVNLSYFKNKEYTRITFYLFILITLHNFIWIFIVHGGTSFINNILGEFIILGSIFIITPALKFENFRSLLYIMAGVSMIGLVYHFIQIARGNIVFQIQLPFMPTPDRSRLLEEGFRPKSFFTEPAAYVGYMTLPLYFLLNEKKHIAVILVVLSIFLSTSTTGIVISFLMIGTFALTQKIGIKRKVIYILMIVLLGYILFNFGHFEYGVNKLENETLSEDVRTSQGIEVIKCIDPLDLVFGIPFESVGDMWDKGQLKGADVVVYQTHGGTVIYMPTFWYMLTRFGVIILFVYIMVYWKLYKQYYKLLPLLVVIVAEWFSSSESIGPNFFYQLCALYAFVDYKKQKGISYLNN